MKPQTEILDLLRGGDRRSIGGSDQAAQIVSRNPKLFFKLIAGLWSDDALIRMRAADAAEKVSRENPALLRTHKRELLELLSEADEQELRWHLAAMIPRLNLNPAELKQAAGTLKLYLQDRSSIVKTFALQALADLAQRDAALWPEVIELLREAERTGTPAMRARSRNILRKLERIS
ncbi:MAG TPA: hypothetical protein VFO34_17605 [Candidatus Acidoferrales bacterium]|nr:hypothetical protein [Candidatus Acidoferrales bacterium]